MMQSTINFDEGIIPNKLWVVAQGKEVKRQKRVRVSAGVYEMQPTIKINAHGCVCGVDGVPMVFTDKRAAERSALVLSKYMSDKLRVFKVSGLKLEVD